MGNFVTTIPGQREFLGRVGIGGPPTEHQLTVGGNISAADAILAGGSITSDSYIYSNNYLGVWGGQPLSGGKVIVEGVDIKSTTVAPFVQFGGADFYLKAAPDGTATWDRITDNEIFFDNQYIDGDLTVVGDIIEYSSNGLVYSKTSVFTKALASGANTLKTFEKALFKTAKYVVTLSSQLTSSTAFEILVTHNGTDSEGTTYGIVDAQASSLLSTVDVSVSGLSIDLEITTTAECDVIAHGTAHY
jgi:hypothetical protein